MNIEILAPDKLAFNLKRRYETQVLSRLSQLPILQHISGKTEIYVLAVRKCLNIVRFLKVVLGDSGPGWHLSKQQLHTAYWEFFSALSLLIFIILGGFTS